MSNRADDVVKTPTPGAIQGLLYQEDCWSSGPEHAAPCWSSLQFGLLEQSQQKWTKLLIFMGHVHCCNACWSYLLQTNSGFNCTGAL